MDDALPPDISQGATQRGKEYGWTISSFPVALARAEAQGYGCLGGQFQFRLDDGSACEARKCEGRRACKTRRKPALSVLSHRKFPYLSRGEAISAPLLISVSACPIPLIREERNR